MEIDTDWKAFGRDTSDTRRSPARIEKMTYRAPGTVSVSAQAASAESEEGEAAAGAEVAATIARLEESLRESQQRAAVQVDELRREGRLGVEHGRLQAKAAIEAAAQQVGSALRSFAAERDEYFAKVEQEVVRLALAIAARILNREASLDPLLLAGAVRVALGQLGETTNIRLRCPPEQVERWRGMLALVPGLTVMPEVIAEQDLLAGDCVLEAQIGTVDLGVRAQLEEIERGFFDLLEQRPGGGRDGTKKSSPAETRNSAVAEETSPPL